MSIKINAIGLFYYQVDKKKLPIKAAYSQNVYLKKETGSLFNWASKHPVNLVFINQHTKVFSPECFV